METPRQEIQAHLPLHEWTSLRTELIWIYDREVRPQYLQGTEPVADYRLWLLRRGIVSFTTGEASQSVGPGMWLMPPRHRSKISFSSDAHILSIRFLCHWPSGENLFKGREGLTFQADKYPTLERDAMKLERMLRRQFPQGDLYEQVYTQMSSDYPTFLRVQALFFTWLTTWFRIQLEAGAKLTRLMPGDSRSFQAARCLNESSLLRPFPMELLRSQTGLGLTRLNQLFFSEFGMTTRKYWDRRRLETAKQYLETSQMPLKEISYQLGFSSDSHFVVWFRRQSGSRPGDFRRSYLLKLPR